MLVLVSSKCNVIVIYDSRKNDLTLWDNLITVLTPTRSFVRICVTLIIESEHDKTNKMTFAPQRRLRSTWTSAQSDQSLRCLHEESLGPSLPIEPKRTLWSDCAGAQADLILCCAHMPLFCFVVLRPTYTHKRNCYRTRSWYILRFMITVSFQGHRCDGNCTSILTNSQTESEEDNRIQIIAQINEGLDEQESVTGRM